MEPIDWEALDDDCSLPSINNHTYQYKNQFNYCVWVPGTVIKLCNVPWDSAYRDVVRFSSEAARDSYFESLTAETLTLTGFVYLRYGEPIRINVPFGEVSQYNYIVVRNPNMPIPGYKDDGLASDPSYHHYEYFYYFINHVEFMAPNTTAVYVQLDVWQTYGYRAVFGIGYLQRGHAGIANTNATEYNLDEYLLEPEALDIGNEYETIMVESIALGSPSVDENPDYDTPLDDDDLTQVDPTQPGEQINPGLYVVISTMASLTSDWGTESNPNLKTATGSLVDMIPQGCETYVLSAENFLMLMSALRPYPWISQCINNITLLPASLIDPLIENAKERGYKPGTVHNVELWTASLVLTSAWKGGQIKSTFRDWRGQLKNGYGDYSRYKKFLTSQYSVIEITTYTGGEIILRPECLSEGDDIVIDYISALSPPNMRVVIYPENYNGTGTYQFGFMQGWEEIASIIGGEGLDMAIVLDNWPQVSLVNNMYQYYLASTVHQRNYAMQNASWEQQRALMEAQTARTNALVGIGKTWQDTQANNAYLSSNTSIQQAQNNFDKSYVQSDAIMAGTVAAVNGAANAVGSALGGNVVGGIIAGAAQAGTGIAQATYNGMKQDNYLNQKSGWIDQGYNASLAQNNALMQNSMDYQKNIADNNYAMANYAAEGNYQQAIAGIQAKVQDAVVKQPTTSGQNGGDLLLFSHLANSVVIKYKVPKPHYIKQVADYWGRFGYAVNRYIQPPQDLILMTNFTYWKFVDMEVWGNIPKLFTDTLQGILEAGVTVWTDPDKIGVTMPQDNEVSVEFSYE